MEKEQNQNLENSEEKTQNSSILAIGNVTPRINKINSIKLKKMKPYFH